MATVAPAHQLIAASLANSFDKWATNNTKYKKLYKKMSPDCRKIITTGLSEIRALNPISWDTWWLKEHNRFRSDGVRQEDKRNLSQIMHAFLGEFARGKIEATSKPRTITRKKSGGKATTKQGRTHEDGGDQSATI